MALSECAQIALDSNLDARNNWRGSRLPAYVESLARQIRGRIVVIQGPGLLATSPVPARAMMVGQQGISATGSVCFPRLGAREFMSGLRENNQVKVITPDTDEIVDQLKNYGIAKPDDNFEGVYPPLVTPRNLQGLLDETKTPYQLLVVTAQNFRPNVTLPHNASALRCSEWEFNQSTWFVDPGMQRIAAAMSGNTRPRGAELWGE